MMQLRLGRYQDVLHDVTCDLLCSDPPYTKRTMLGFRSGSEYRNARRRVTRARGARSRKPRFSIPYAALTEQGALELAQWACARTRHWIVLFNDHEGWRWLRDAVAAQGWYTFAPLVWRASNSPPRFRGDGPNNPLEYILIARPRRVVRWGHREGFYDVPRLSSLHSESEGLTGQKPLALMRQVIGDYSRKGWLVCDPFAGTGSTLLAAHQLGRRAVGAELDPERHARALDRLVRGIAL